MNNKARLQEVVDYYNEIYNKRVRSVRGFEKNFEFWLEYHTIDEMKEAIAKARSDVFWWNKLTLSILFRRRNPRGEDVDYIEDFINREAYQSEGNVINLDN